MTRTTTRTTTRTMTRTTTLLHLTTIFLHLLEVFHPTSQFVAFHPESHLLLHRFPHHEADLTNAVDRHAVDPLVPVHHLDLLALRCVPTNRTLTTSRVAFLRPSIDESLRLPLVEIVQADRRIDRSITIVADGCNHPIVYVSDWKLPSHLRHPKFPLTKNDLLITHEIKNLPPCLSPKTPRNSSLITIPQIFHH